MRYTSRHRWPGGPDGQAPLAGHVRIGGFGGPAGLAAYLTEHGVGRLIDATHPFASPDLGCGAAGMRAGQCPPADVAATPLAPSPARPLDRGGQCRGRRGDRRAHRGAALGSRSAPVRSPISAPRPRSIILFVSSIHRASALPLQSYEVIVGRGPFLLAEERNHIECHEIDVLVCKASGGAATEAKIIAARERGLPVIMVRRPPASPAKRSTPSRRRSTGCQLPPSRDKEGVMKTRLTSRLSCSLRSAPSACQLGIARRHQHLRGLLGERGARGPQERCCPGQIARCQ